MQAEMPADGALAPLQVPPSLPPTHPLAHIIPTTNAAVAAWTQHMGETQWLTQLGSSSSNAASWLQLPWLVVECYLYVRLATIMAQQVGFRQHHQGSGAQDIRVYETRCHPPPILLVSGLRGAGVDKGLGANPQNPQP